MGMTIYPCCMIIWPLKKVNRELAGFAAARGNLLFLEARRTPMRRPQPNPAVRASVTCRECEDSNTILLGRNKHNMWLGSIRRGVLQVHGNSNTWSTLALNSNCLAARSWIMADVRSSPVLVSAPGKAILHGEHAVVYGKVSYVKVIASVHTRLWIHHYQCP